MRAAGPGRRRRQVRRRAAGRRLLVERGDLEDAIPLLRARADAGDGTPPSGWSSCWSSGATSRTILLRVRADAGDEDAAWRLVELLAKRGDIDELRAPGPTAGD